MAVTRLERKLKRDRAKAKRRIATMKRLNSLPPVKNIDIEAIKAEFEKKKGGSASKVANSKESSAPKTEAKAATKSSEGAEVKAEAPKAEEAKADASEKKSEAKKSEEAPKAKAKKEESKKEDSGE